MSDTFVFDVSHTGSDRVGDLEPWDRIALTGFGYADTEVALSHFSQSGSNTVFFDRGVTVNFEHTLLSEITPDMILLTL